MRTSIDPTTLRELLRYDAGDGVLYWRERDSKFFQPTEKREASGHAKWWNGRFAGKRACKSDCNRGYLRVCLFGDEYPAHRVIWAMETGQWPTNVIDHIDGDPANNRIANLRPATTAENNRNKANHGRSRFRGVSWRARQSIWVSAIKTNKKVTFLGCYKNEEDAARAYDVAAIEQHGNFARTNFPRSDYEARIKSALVEVPAVKGEPEPVAWVIPGDDNARDNGAIDAMAWEEGEFTKPLYAAQPADAGMREAFVRVLASLAAAISILERTPKAKKAVASDKMFDTMLDDYRKALEIGRAALTAPGATTKSDGGAKAGSSPILASKEDQRTRAHGVMLVGDNADASGCTGTGPSDPSSARSDVTVESIARIIEPSASGYTREYRKATEIARALLDRFQIRRK